MPLTRSQAHRLSELKRLVVRRLTAEEQGLARSPPKGRPLNDAAAAGRPPPQPSRLRPAIRLEALRPGRRAGLLAAVALLALLLQLGIESVAPQRGGLLSTAGAAVAAWRPSVACALTPSCLLAQPRAAAGAARAWAAARAGNATAALRAWPTDWRARRRQQQEEEQRVLAAAVVGSLQSELAAAVGEAKAYRQQLAAANASLAEAVGALASCQRGVVQLRAEAAAAKEGAAAEVRAAKEAAAAEAKAAREGAATEVRAAREAAAKAAAAAQAVNRELQQELGAAGARLAQLAAEKEQADRLGQRAATETKRAEAALASRSQDLTSCQGARESAQRQLAAAQLQMEELQRVAAAAAAAAPASASPPPAANHAAQPAGNNDTSPAAAAHLPEPWAVPALREVSVALMWSAAAAVAVASMALLRSERQLARMQRHAAAADAQAAAAVAAGSQRAAPRAARTGSGAQAGPRRSPAPVASGPGFPPRHAAAPGPDASPLPPHPAAVAAAAAAATAAAALTNVSRAQHSAAGQAVAATGTAAEPGAGLPALEDHAGLGLMCKKAGEAPSPEEAASPGHVAAAVDGMAAKVAALAARRRSSSSPEEQLLPARRSLRYPSFQRPSARAIAAWTQRSPGGPTLLTSSDDAEAAAAACRGLLEGAIAAGDAAAAADAGGALLAATLDPAAASARALRASLNPLFRQRSASGGGSDGGSDAGEPDRESTLHLVPSGGGASGELLSECTASSSHNPLFRPRASSAAPGGTPGGSASEGGEAPQHLAAPGAGVSREPSAAPASSRSSLNPLFRARTSSCGSAGQRGSGDGARRSQSGGPPQPPHLAPSAADLAAAPSAEPTAASSSNPLYLPTLSSEVEAKAAAVEAAAAPLLAAGASAAAAALACPNPLLARHAAAQAAAAQHAAAAVGHQVELLRREVVVLQQGLAAQEAAAADAAAEAAEEPHAAVAPGGAAAGQRDGCTAGSGASGPEAARRQLVVSQAALAGAEAALVAAQAEAVAALAEAVARGVHVGPPGPACSALVDGSQVQGAGSVLPCHIQEAEELLPQPLCIGGDGPAAVDD